MKKCPFCAEDIQDAAIVCKHCGRDILGAASAKPTSALKQPTSTETTCPRCGSKIAKRLDWCPQCGKDLATPAQTPLRFPQTSPDAADKKALPFSPIPGATPTSGLIYFLLAFILVILSVLLGSAGPMILIVGTSIWVAVDASKHKIGQYQSGLGGPVGASLGSLLLWIIAFPWYLAVRSRIRAGIQPVRMT